MSRSAWLVRAVEGQIVPRLLIHAVNVSQGSGPLLQRWRPTTDDISQFANILIDHNTAIGVAYVQMRREQGAALSVLYLELLAPAAAHLRDLRQHRRLGWLQLIRARYRLLHVVRTLRAAAPRPATTIAAE